MAVKGLKVNSLNMSDDVPGMVLLNTISFNAVSAVSFNDVFTSDYVNYKVLFDITPSTSFGIAIRFRAAGTDTSTGYNTQIVRGSSTNVTGVRPDANATSARITGQDSIGTTRTTFLALEIQQPQLSSITTFSSTFGDNGQLVLLLNGAQTSTTSFDGITISPSSAGTFSGKISVYGYNE